MTKTSVTFSEDLHQCETVALDRQVAELYMLFALQFWLLSSLRRMNSLRRRLVFLVFQYICHRYCVCCFIVMKKSCLTFVDCLLANINNVEIRSYRGRITYGQEARQQLNSIVVIVQNQWFVCPSRVMVVVVDVDSASPSSL